MRWFSSISGNSEKMAVVLSRTIDMAGGLAFLKLVSTHASKADMGAYLLATSIVALLLTVSFSALSQGVLRNVSDYKKSGELPQRYTAALIGFMLSAPLYAWLALSFIQALGVSDTLSPYIFLIVIWVASDALKTLNSSVAAALRQRYLIAAASALDYSVKLGAIGFCILGGQLDTSMIILIMASASATVGLFIILMQNEILAKTNINICINTLKEALHFSWPMIIWGGFGWAQNMSGRWVLEIYMGAESVASFGLIATIGSLPVNALFGVVVTYIQPILYEVESKQPGKSINHINRTLKIISPSLLSILLISYMFQSQIIDFAASNAYREDAIYLPLVVGAVILSSIGSTMSYFALAKKKASSLLLANILPGLLSIALGIVLVPSLGLKGAFMAMAASHLLSFLLHALNFQRNFKNIVIKS